MEYRNYGGTFYVRLDRDDEIIGSLIKICRENHIASATYSGIGGCRQAEIQTFRPETSSFETELLEGMLELLSLNGNINSDEDGALFAHTHALFSYLENGEHRTAGGHIKSITVLYTAEIRLDPVRGGTIGRRHDPETGTGFWDFE